jgi:hypothetical protein
MASRNQAKTQHADDITLISDIGELPGYNTDEYRDRVNSARRKFDRLIAFTSDEFEVSFEEHKGRIDWEAKRNEKIKALDRWSRDTFGVIRELLFHQLGDDKTLLEVCSLDRSTKKETRSKRLRSERRKWLCHV